MEEQVCLSEEISRGKVRALAEGGLQLHSGGGVITQLVQNLPQQQDGLGILRIEPLGLLRLLFGVQELALIKETAGVFHSQVDVAGREVDGFVKQRRCFIEVSGRRRGRGKAVHDQAEEGLEFRGRLLFFSRAEMLARGSVVGKGVGGRVLFLDAGTESQTGCNKAGQKKTEQRARRHLSSRRSAEHFPSFHYRFRNPQRRFFSLLWSGSIIEYRFCRTERESTMKQSSLHLPAAIAYAILSLSGAIAVAQIDNTTPEWKKDQSRGQMEDAAAHAEVKTVKVPREVKVSVEMDKPRGVMAPWVMAVHSLVSDAHLSDPEVIPLLRAAGITTVRYPGGRIADTYHWSTYHPSNWQGLDHPNVGYAPANDLGSFVKFMEQVGTTIFTVNYGSNLAGTGPGEPAEAAAWVAYANGNPTETKPIGKDSAGNDWQTVGYWAGLRAATPLPVDDGKNFLRIGHAAPLGIRYWEVGNEVFENGYFGGEGLEEDLHAAYPKEAKENAKLRKKNASLSPEAYGKSFVQFAQAMKAVDPRIRVGVSLDKPVAGQINRDEWSQDPVTGKYQQNASVSVKEDFNKGIDWDKGVLSTACNEVDFVTLHWYPSDTTQDSGYKDLDSYKLLAGPQDTLRPILAGLVEQMQKACGQRTRSIQVAFTEVGVAPYVNVPESEEVVLGLFVADLYPQLVEYGVINADWAELHNGSFLDNRNKPGPQYFGMQMVHALMNFNDAVLTATSSSSMLSVHASKRADGSLGLMLINKDGKNATTAKVQVSGGGLAAKGMRFDYGKTNPPDGNSVTGKPIEGVGNSFSVAMPPFTATVVLIPKSQ